MSVVRLWVVYLVKHGSRIQNNVMALIDSGSWICIPNGSDYRFCVLITMEFCWRADDAEIHISKIVGDGASSRSPTDDLDCFFDRSRALIEIGGRAGWRSSPLNQFMVYFEPWVLVPANDDAWPVHVQE